MGGTQVPSNATSPSEHVRSSAWRLRSVHQSRQTQRTMHPLPQKVERCVILLRPMLLRPLHVSFLRCWFGRAYLAG